MVRIDFQFCPPVVGSSYNVCLLSLVSAELGGIFPVLAELKSCSESWTEFAHKILYIVLWLSPMLFGLPKVCLLILQAWKTVDSSQSFHCVVWPGLEPAIRQKPKNVVASFPSSKYPLPPRLPAFGFSSESSVIDLYILSRVRGCYLWYREGKQNVKLKATPQFRATIGKVTTAGLTIHKGSSGPGFLLCEAQTTRHTVAWAESYQLTW